MRGLLWQVFALCIVNIVMANQTKAMKYDETKERYSTSVLGLLKLHKLEQEYVKILQIYPVRNSTLRKYINSLQANLIGHTNLEEYLSNILNAFALIRRTHEDWPKWQKFMKTILNANEMAKINEIISQAPDKQDMKEMLQNMHNTERINNLNAMDLAQGLLQNRQYDFKLSIRDCVAIGRYKYEIGDYARAITWYHSALKYTIEPNGDQFNDILGDPQVYLNQTYAQALFIQSLVVANISIDMEQIRENTIKEINNLKPDVLNTLVSQFLSLSDADLIDKISLDQEEPSITDLGCQSLLPRRTNLVCRYNFTTSPFLRLAPLKLEEVHLDPYIVIYHDVLSDSEIDKMKREASNTLMSNAWTETKRENQTDIRKVIARLTWLKGNSSLTYRINQRIMDMTGFSMTGTESLQVVNYGPGCNFRPHYDYMAEGYEPPNILSLGDRLASIIFYASDLVLGGATVFPRLNVTVTPKKGTSLFWYNTYDDGTQDPRSQHAVCPTIIGSRWTMTKWIHLYPQMFLKPCRPRK